MSQGDGVSKLEEELRSARPPEHARFPCFDGVRAIAALSVILFHAVADTTAFRGVGGRYFAQLNTGVWVFFVTSGFLLYRPFARAHVASGPNVVVHRYAIRRVARIYPAYWVALAYFTFVAPRAHIVGAPDFALHVTLTQTYAHGQLFTGIPLAWSLVVEISFYMFLPFYAAAVGAIARHWSPVAVEMLGVASLGAIGIATLVLYAEGHAPQWATVLPIQLHVFALGMFLAVLSARSWRGAAAGLVERAGRVPWLWWSLALASFVAIPVVLGVEPGHPLSVTNEVAGELCRALVDVFVVVPAVLGASNRGLIRRLLQSAALTLLGVISYGLYLWHYFLLLIAQSDWLGWRLYTGNAFALLAVTLPLIIAAAALSWYLVERPCVALSHGRGLRRPPASARAATA